MPDIPQVDGVPPLTSYVASSVVLLTADALATALSTVFGVQWGIFLNGLPVLTYDSFVSFEYHQDWRISTYPIEGGSFETYDKVQTPGEIRIRIAAGGSTLNRFAMLQTIDAVMSTTELYDVATPEKIYLSYNFVRREYIREADNVGIIAVDLVLMEVIQTATAQFQNTATPVVAGQVSAGNVSTAMPSQAATTAVSGNIN